MRSGVAEAGPWTGRAVDASRGELFDEAVAFVARQGCGGIVVDTHPHDYPELLDISSRLAFSRSATTAADVGQPRP
jgi:hypothetical protein